MSRMIRTTCCRRCGGGPACRWPVAGGRAQLSPGWGGGHRGRASGVARRPGCGEGGASAAAQAGADYVALGRAEIYVHPDRVDKLEAEFGMVRDEERGNVSLRIPPAEMWSFLTSRSETCGQGHDAPASVVAADLLDLHEGRADAAAAGLLESLLARYAQPRRA
ncbi:type IV toxin-antitoxin system AbiEi family antitoxin [Streptomyces sp. APSN-46.1]|uniref:type IV toxin-antitoxin system AbiEi family antitoxin n=1 Tax=Streptomyces sp. APSN-46.1 TaxID=2929049 RepID=UPI0035ABE5F6